MEGVCQQFKRVRSSNVTEVFEEDQVRKLGTIVLLCDLVGEKG